MAPTNIRCHAQLSSEESDVEETKKPMMLAKTVIVLAIAMNFQPRRTLAAWRPLQTDDGGVDDQYDAATEDSETEETGDRGGAALRPMNLIDFAGRGPTDMNDNAAYALASSSADEDSADASSSLDLGRYVEGATEEQGTDNRWPLSVQPPRKKRDASKLNPQAKALQMKHHKAVGGGSSKALSADMKDWSILRSKRRTRPQSELQRMVILGNLLDEDYHDYDGRHRISAYGGALKRAPASYQAPPAKSRVAAGMRYAGIGKRKVNVRSRVDAGMRYMGIGKRHY